jgi:hypothetical protein
VGERRERALQIAGRIVSEMNARGIGVRKLQEGVRAYFVEQKLDPYGTSYGTIRSYSQGRVLKPRREVLEAIASALSVQAPWLISGDGYRTERDQKLADEGYDIVLVGDDWGLNPDLYHRIMQSLLLPKMPNPVRSLFWETVGRLAHHPMVTDQEELYDAAQLIEHWVLSPVEKFRLGHPDSAPTPQLMTYYVGALNGLFILFTIEHLPAVVKEYLSANPGLNVGRFFDDMEETKGSKEDV